MSDDGKVSISKITLSNFRQHESLEVQLKDLNVIVGGNGAGKTSILEAICYGLFGAVANGATKKELIKVGAKNGGVTITLSNNYKIVRDFGNTIKLLDANDRVVSEKASEIESYLSIDKNLFMNLLYAAQNEIYTYFIKFNAKEKDFMDGLFNLTDMTDSINSALKDSVNILTNQYNLVSQMKNTKATLSKYISDTLSQLNLSTIEDLYNVISNTYEMLQRYKIAYESHQQNQSLLSSLASYESNRNMLISNIQSITNRANDTSRAIEDSKKKLSDYISQLSTNMKVSIDSNNLDAFYKMLYDQTSITTHIDNIVKAVEIGQSAPNRAQEILAYILVCTNTIKQLDQYKTYYYQIIDTLKKLSNDVSNVASRQSYDANDLNNLKNQLSSIEEQIVKIKDTISSKSGTTDDLSTNSNIGNLYIQQQSRYSMLETSYKNLLAYQSQLESLEDASYVCGDNVIDPKSNLSDTEIQLLLKVINGIIPVFNRDGFVSYLRKSLLKEIAVSIGDSLEKFGFTKLIPVDIDDKSGALMFHGRAFRSLSGGEKTIASILLRVLYARLLAPSIRINLLMLDEPTADLDSIRVGYLRQMLFKISKMMNMQIIMVTHDESVIPDQANLIVINSQMC